MKKGDVKKAIQELEKLYSFNLASNNFSNHEKLLSAIRQHGSSSYSSNSSGGSGGSGGSGSSR